jgi:hypothetical protein
MQVKIQNDGRTWRQKKWVLIDDPEAYLWKWVGGTGEPSYINDEIEKPSGVEKNSDHDVDATASEKDLRQVVRQFKGTWHQLYEIVGQELANKYPYLQQ